MKSNNHTFILLSLQNRHEMHYNLSSDQILDLTRNPEVWTIEALNSKSKKGRKEEGNLINNVSLISGKLETGSWCIMCSSGDGDVEIYSRKSVAHSA